MPDLSPTLLPSRPAPASESGVPQWTWPEVPGYPLGRSGLQPCEIEGLNGHISRGQLVDFDLRHGRLHVLLGSSGAPLKLRLHQFRCLRLQEPLEPPPGAPVPAPTSYRLRLSDAQWREGRSVGYVEAAQGLFLFEPVGGQGRLCRLFVPRDAFQAVEFKDGDTGAAHRVGDLLESRRIAGAAPLLQALQVQASMPQIRIGEALMALGLITQAELEQALNAQQQDRSVPLGELLVRACSISRAELQTALARKMGYPVVDVLNFPAEADAVRRLPFAVAKRLMALPLLLREGRLVVALEDPSARDTIDELQFIAQCKVVPTLAPTGQIERALVQVYERLGMDTSSAISLRPQSASLLEGEADDAAKLLESLEQQQAPELEDERQIEQSDNSLVRLVNTMVLDALAQKASDIHIETQPGREKVRIRFRKDGQLKPYLDLPHTYRAALVARLKIMCDLDISERRKPQDGKINFARFSAQHRLELRVATIPTFGGLEDVVLRLLSSAKPMPMDQLGLSASNLPRLRAAVERPYGLVLCVGPTGSGKTTTLHSALGHLNTPERKIWTAEDPIEITQPGLRQVQVNPKIDWTFAKALRAFLRADPDVIMVGEIRDQETAQVAIEASLTGHLVMSTLHTNSAPETVTRLLDMGMDPFNFADSLLAVLAQRLVRQLCPKCVQPRAATDAEVEELLGDYLHACPADLRPEPAAVLADWRQRFGRDGGRLQSYAAPGCPHCEGSGWHGRTALHELMTVSGELRCLIQGGGRVETLQRQALREGMRTLRQDGIEKVLQGITSIDEVRATSNV